MNDVKVGFVGAVTEELPSWCRRPAWRDCDVTDIVDATNAAAADLKAGGADIVVLLVHEGAPVTDCARRPRATPDRLGDRPTTTKRPMSTRSSPATPTCSTTASSPCPGGSPGRDVTERPVVSSGQYGTNLNKLVSGPDADQVVAKSQAMLPLTEGSPTTPRTRAAGSIVQPRSSGRRRSGRRCWARSPVRSTGRSVQGPRRTAVASRPWATWSPRFSSGDQWREEGGAVAFMNPGGLRADMTEP